MTSEPSVARPDLDARIVAPEPGAEISKGELLPGAGPAPMRPRTSISLRAAGARR